MSPDGAAVARPPRLPGRLQPVGPGASTVSRTGPAAGPDLDRRTITSTNSASLDGVLAGRSHLPGTAGYDAARDGFDLSAIPAPDVAVSATDEADVATAVRFAAGRGLPVAVREVPVLSKLQVVKAAWDPQDLFRFTVTIPPAGTTERADSGSPRTGAAPLPGSA